MNRAVFVELPLDVDAPAKARGTMDGLYESIPENVLGDLRLVVSEVVTNAYRHATFTPGKEEKVTLRATRENDHLTCEVCDTSDGFEPPDSSAPHEDLAGGWGLLLLDELSDKWTTTRNDMFCVIFEMSW